MSDLRLTLDRDQYDHLLIVHAATGDTVATLADTALAASLARTLSAAPQLLDALDDLLGEVAAPHRCSSNGSGHFVSARTQDKVTTALRAGRGGAR